MRRGRQSGSRSRLLAQINVTPFVDVSLVLLIIFMVVTPSIIREVDLPITENPPAAPERESQIRVLLFDSETVVINDLVLRRDQLSSELAARYAPNRELVVKASRTLRYGEVTSVLRDCRTAGYETVLLAASRDS